MKRRMKPRRKQHRKVAVFGEVVREDLPFQVVYYPVHYGTFLAFSEAEDSKSIFVCSCAEGAVQNWIALRRLREEPENTDPLRSCPIPSGIFPGILAERYVHLGLGALAFERGLCHRCNLKPPSLAFCHAIYGGVFKQTYGWYINQTYLRLGVNGPQLIDFLDDICPADLRHEAELCKEANLVYLAELEKLNALVYGPERSDIAMDEITYWHNVKIEEAEPMVTARRKAEKLKTALSNRLENITRQEFGFRKVGEGWVSETLLAQIIERLFPGKHIIRHDRPDWLEGLELDIHIPELGLAFEYQG